MGHERTCSSYMTDPFVPVPHPPTGRVTTLWRLALVLVVLLGAGLLLWSMRTRDSQGSKAIDAPGAADAGSSTSADARVTGGSGIDSAVVSKNCLSGMVPIAAGTFVMGSFEEDARPHEVRLSEYCIDKTETTAAEYANCVQAGACTSATTAYWSKWSADEAKKQSRWCNLESGRPTHPINCVDWKQAASYCEWRHGRLPTEAEWEYAARGASKRDYPWGSDDPNATRVNACGPECVEKGLYDRSDGDATSGSLYEKKDGFETTAPVGSFPLGASPFGVLDMAGNVWEWTADWYGDYPTSSEPNPTGKKTGELRVDRGGSWGERDATSLRAAHRSSDEPSLRSPRVGFRCVAAWH